MEFYQDKTQKMSLDKIVNGYIWCQYISTENTKLTAFCSKEPTSGKNTVLKVCLIILNYLDKGR